MNEITYSHELATHHERTHPSETMSALAYDRTHDSKPVKTVVCSPQVLQSVTDESLVRTCQRGDVAILTSEAATVPFDAAQLELCRRYEPLILKYAHLSAYMEIQDDVESFLWLVFIESIYSYDVQGSVPFAGYVKAAIHYGQINFFKHITRAWNYELTVPTTVDDDVADIAMDKFPDESTVGKNMLDAEEELQLREKLKKACQSLPPDQQDLLRRIYLEHTSLSDLAAMWHTSKQAIQQRHQRALKRLRQYMTHV